MVDGGTYVSVVGGGRCDERTYRIAYEVGRGVAERGAVLVCGGLGGVMEAACKGAKSKGGLTVGILPSDDRRDANPYVDVAVPTAMGEARNAIVARSGDGLIAVGGEFGTLSEIALALKIGKPVAGIETWEISKGGKTDKSIRRAASAEDALTALFDRLGA